tara:strand:- start:340 stop:534 length:195 start_codon:yes stop_codon:yes gene_type:complete
MKIGDLVKPNYETDAVAIVLTTPAVVDGFGEDEVVNLKWVGRWANQQEDYYSTRYLEVVSSAKR